MSLNLSSISFLTHPIVLCIFQTTITALVVGFTSTASIVRLAIIPLILIVQWYTILLCPYWVHYSIMASCIGGHSSILIVQYIELALRSKWAFAACGPTTLDPNLRMAQPRTIDEQLKPKTFKGQGHGTVYQRVRFGFSACFSTRMTGTPLEVKGVRPFSMEDPSYIPTRSKFLLKESMKFLICYLVIDILTAGQSPDANSDVYSLHLVPFFTRLNTVTAEHVIVRILMTICFWIIIYCMMQVIHSTMAIVAVASGLTDVKGWRPLFGPLSQAYTIRQFWSVFWHQLHRQTYSSPASWITYSFLRLRKGGLSGRYLFCFLVFLVSGLQHTGANMAEGMSWQKSGSIRFFVTQFVGVVLEDVAQEFFRRIGGRSGGWRARALGFVWVFAFLVWSTPAWTFPGLVEHTGEEKEKVVPFSIVGSLLRFLRYDK